MFKPSKGTSDKYNDLLQKLFDETVDNAESYQMLYVYDQVTKNYILFKKYVTTNYILGYTLAYDRFVLFQFHDENENEKFIAGPVEHFLKSDILSFKKNWFGKHILKLRNGKEYKFIIQTYIPNIPGAYTLPILQEQKVTDFLKSI